MVNGVFNLCEVFFINCFCCKKEFFRLFINLLNKLFNWVNLLFFLLIGICFLSLFVFIFFIVNVNVWMLDSIFFVRMVLFRILKISEFIFVISINKKILFIKVFDIFIFLIILIVLVKLVVIIGEWRISRCLLWFWIILYFWCFIVFGCC